MDKGCVELVVYVRDPNGGFEGIRIAQRDHEGSEWKLHENRVFPLPQEPATHKWRGASGLVFRAKEGPREDDPSVTNILTTLDNRQATLFRVAGSIPCAIVPTHFWNKTMRHWYQASFYVHPNNSPLQKFKPWGPATSQGPGNSMGGHQVPNQQSLHPDAKMHGSEGVLFGEDVSCPRIREFCGAVNDMGGCGIIWEGCFFLREGESRTARETRSHLANPFPCKRKPVRFLQVPGVRGSNRSQNRVLDYLEKSYRRSNLFVEHFQIPAGGRSQQLTVGEYWDAR